MSEKSAPSIPKVNSAHSTYPGEFTLNGDELLALTIQLLFSLEVTAGRLADRFDMAQRGGFIRIVYPPGTFDVENAAVEIITAPSPG